jgi:hypothetical protein
MRFGQDLPAQKRLELECNFDWAHMGYIYSALKLPFEAIFNGVPDKISA